jgi:hypothetical protein
MAKIDVSYVDLEGIDPAYVENLREKEDTVRQAVTKIGRSCSVRWIPFDAGEKHLFFRLTAYSDRRDDCIAQISSLDLTLDADAFEKPIVEGQRPCQ